MSRDCLSPRASALLGHSDRTLLDVIQDATKEVLISLEVHIFFPILSLSMTESRGGIYCRSRNRAAETVQNPPSHGLDAGIPV
jgi:hypothetical protein